MDKSITNTATTANDQVRVGGFQGKHHDLATKNRISQTQKARYNYMRQMMRQQQQESQKFGPINVDDPSFTQKIKDIVRELLHEEIRNAIPSKKTMQNIPIF